MDFKGRPATEEILLPARGSRLPFVLLLLGLAQAFSYEEGHFQ